MAGTVKILNGRNNDSVKACKGKSQRMGSWRMFISYIWRSKEDLTDKPIFYSFLDPPEEFFETRHYSPNKRSAKLGYHHQSPAFRRKGLLKRQG